MAFLSKEQIINLFKDFDIIEFKESEKDGKTGIGKFKHWHTFDVIANKESQSLATLIKFLVAGVRLELTTFGLWEFN